MEVRDVNGVADPLADPTRLAAVAATGLTGIVGAVTEPILERLASVAQRLVAAPVALVTLLTAGEQWVVGAAGNGVPLLPGRRMPIAYALCQHVVRSAEAVVVDDTTAHALMSTSPIVTEHGVRAYLGVPLTTAAGQHLGALCALDFAPRSWSAEDVAGLRDLAAAATAHLEHRMTRASLRIAESALTVTSAKAAAADAQFAIIADVNADGLWRWDIVSNEIRHSQRFRALLGMTSEPEGSVAAFLTALHPDDVETFTTALQAHLTTRTPFDIHVRVVVADGSFRWFHNRGQAVWDATGVPTFMAGTLSDVTEQVRTAAALRVSEAQLAEVVDAAMDAVISISADGDILRFNRAAQHVFGLDATDAVHRSLNTLLPTWRQHVAGDSDDATRGGLFALTGRRADGRIFPAEATIAQTADSASSPTATMTVMVRDVTERTQLEAALRHAQKMDAVGRLAGGIAHDFNNLLTVIRGSAELASASLLTDVSAQAVQSEVDQVVQAADRAAALTRQLLAFSRKQVLEPQLVCLDDVVEDIAPLLRRLLGAHVAITVHAASRPHEVLVDPGQFEQVLVNLAINARDAMPTGGTLTIESRFVSRSTIATDAAARVAPDVALVLVTVTDTGMGMDAITLARVFEPFFTTKEVGQGTGLGLSVVQGIIEQSGGTIWVTSAMGAGTCVSCLMPTSTAGMPVARPVATPQKLLPASGHVLLVEDDQHVRAVAARMLAAAGYVVSQCADGEEALSWCRADAARAGGLCAVVSDVQMPYRNGISLALALASEFANLPVLLMSADAPGTTGRARAGMSQWFLQKPFTRDQLLRQLDEMVRVEGVPR